MKLENIDKLFKNNEEQFNKMPSDALWDRLDEALPVTEVTAQNTSSSRTTRRWLYYLAAAAVLLLFIVPISLYFPGNDHQLAKTQSHKAADAATTEEVAATTIKELEADAVHPSTFDHVVDQGNDQNHLQIAAKNATPKPRTIESSKDKTSEVNIATAPIKKRRTNEQVGAPNTNNNFFSNKNPNSDSKPTLSTTTTQDLEKEIADIESLAEEEAPKDAFMDGDFETEAKKSIVSAPPAPSSKTKTATLPAIDPAFARYYQGHTSPVITNSGAPISQSDAQPEMARQERKLFKKKSRNKNKKAPRKKQEGLSYYEIDDAATAGAIPSINYDWLVGNWQSQDKSVNIIETWEKVNTKTFKAKSKVTIDGQLLYEEVLSLNASNNQLAYKINSTTQKESKEYNNQIQEPTQFVVTRDNSNYPQKIKYQFIAPNRLLIYFEGIKDGQFTTNVIELFKTP